MAAAFPVGEVIESGVIDNLQENMRILDVPGDGNCLFHAVLLSLQLTYPDFMINGTRARDHTYQSFLEFLRVRVSEESDIPEIVRESIWEDSCYGERETINYLARLLNINVQVYLINNPMRNDFISSYRNPTINLINLGNHYNSVVDESILAESTLPLETLIIRTPKQLLDQYNEIIEDGISHQKLVNIAKKQGVKNPEFMTIDELNKELKEYLDKEENQIETTDDEEIAKILQQITNPELSSDEELARLLNEEELRNSQRKKYLKYKQKYLLLKKSLKKIEN